MTSLDGTFSARSGAPGRLRSIALIAGSIATVVATDARAQPQPTAPAAVYSVGAAADSARGRLVVFGGYGKGGYNGETWEWNRSAWSRLTDTGPSPRNSPALAYDGSRRSVLLFGGDTRATGALGDTWQWDGGQWREVAAEGPPPRSTHAMAYDSRRGRIVLFGGAAGAVVLGDTWEWDGARWTRVASDGPPARALHGLAYDAARGRVVLFGGSSGLTPDSPMLADTWEWDGTRWTRMDISGPGPRDHVAMAYDVARGLTVLHGGGRSPAERRETWTYDGRAWVSAATDGPPRMWAKLVYDARARDMLLYGGFDREPSNEVWRFSGTGWERLAP